jgi:large subunit ribosomal protein L29
MIKMREINNLTKTEIEQRLKDSREELENLKFQLSTHQLDDTSQVKIVRRDIARLITVLKEFDLDLRKPLQQSGGVINEQ